MDVPLDKPVIYHFTLSEDLRLNYLFKLSIMHNFKSNQIFGIFFWRTQNIDDGFYWRKFDLAWKSMSKHYHNIWTGCMHLKSVQDFEQRQGSPENVNFSKLNKLNPLNSVQIRGQTNIILSTVNSLPKTPGICFHSDGDFFFLKASFKNWLADFDS